MLCPFFPRGTAIVKGKHIETASQLQLQVFLTSGDITQKGQGTLPKTNMEGPKIMVWKRMEKVTPFKHGNFSYLC